MKRLKIITVLMLTVLIMVCTEKAEAQRGRGRGRGRVARHVVVRDPHRSFHRVVVRRAHIRYAHLPRWGTVVTTVPAAAVIIRTQRNPYYFHEGVYYVPRNAGYAIVRPAPGIRIRMLPPG